MSVGRWLTWEPQEPEFSPHGGGRRTARTDTRGDDEASGSCVSTFPGDSQRRFPALAPPIAILAPSEGQCAYVFRVIVDALEPVRAPVAIRPGVQVVDVQRATVGMLADLAIEAMRYGATSRGERYAREATEHGERIDELIEDLRKCGVRVRIARLQ